EVLPAAQIQFCLIDDSAGQDHEISSVSALPDVQLVTPPYNMGHQAAIVLALRSLGTQVDANDVLITMDSDGEDRPGDLPELIRPLLGDRDNIHLISLARRTKRQESVVFKIYYNLFKLLFKSLTGTVIYNGNFVAFRGWLVKELIFHPHFDHCYSSSFISIPLQRRSVPIPRGQRYFGRSHMGFLGLFTHGVRMLMPFSEKIATRGLLANAVLLVTSIIGIGVCFALESRLLVLFGFLFVLSSLLLGVSLLLFATFSQNKSRSLRGLSDPGMSNNGRSN
ncbi:MAG: glycosyltransferase, partial [Bdellovibrionota bacterium]